MAFLTTPRPHGSARRVAGLVTSLTSVVSDWSKARATRDVLSRLSAHELDDIGLAPGDIDRIASRR